LTSFAGVVNLLSGRLDAQVVCDTDPLSTPSAHRDQCHRFPGELIHHGVRLSFRFCPSSRDVEELLFAGGVIVAAAYE